MLSGIEWMFVTSCVQQNTFWPPAPSLWLMYSGPSFWRKAVWIASSSSEVNGVWNVNIGKKQSRNFIEKSYKTKYNETASSTLWFFSKNESFLKTIYQLFMLIDQGSFEITYISETRRIGFVSNRHSLCFMHQNSDLQFCDRVWNLQQKSFIQSKRRIERQFARLHGKFKFSRDELLAQPIKKRSFIRVFVLHKWRPIRRAFLSLSVFYVICSVVLKMHGCF